MDEASTPKPARDRARYTALYPMWIALFVDVLGYSIFIPLFPFISDRFPGGSPIVVSFLLATNAVFGLVFGPLLGSLSDKFGRKPLLMVSLAGTMTGFLVFAFAPSIEFLFLSRAIDGIFGGVYPITRAVIGDIVPIKNRSKQMANMGVVHIIASMGGPAAGGILAERTGTLLAPGLLAVVFALSALVITAAIFKETLPIKTGMYQGAPLQRAETKAPSQLAQAGVGDVPLVKNKVALYILAQWGFHSLYFMILVAMGGLYLGVHIGLNSEEIGLLMMLSSFIRIVVRYSAFVPILNKLGDHKTATFGLLLFALGFFWLIFVNNWIQYLISLIVTSFAATCARGPMNSFISRSVSKYKQGRIQGIANSLEKVGEIIGPIIGGTVLALVGGAGYGLLLFSISCIPFAMSFKKLVYPGEASIALHEKPQ
nr:MFS transporter [Candidatus Sigynarchaeum springense]